jgi:hypothetical protein
MVIAVVGLFLMVLVIWLLDRLGAPAWVASMPWWAPTVAAAAWVALRPSPAVVSNDDDHSWGGFAIRFVMVGEGEARPMSTRIITAVVVGAPLAWSMLIFGALAAAGLFEL